MNVIISIGHGRLHLIQSAKWIAEAGVSVKLICGWVPRCANSLWVRLASKIVGRDLTAGMAKRIVRDAAYETCTCTFAEVVDQVLRIACRRLGISTQRVASLGWSVFGWQSRGYLRDAQVFHVRSGAGQGGAIQVARKRGMRILVDHSALHPTVSERLLRDDYARWGQEIVIAPNLGVWRNVEQDCREADMIMVNADHIRDSFVEEGYDPQKVRVVYLGVREDFWGLKKEYWRQGRITVLFTGGFQILKGAEYLLQSLEILKSRGVDARCLVVGEVAIPHELKERYGDLPVRYFGHIPQDELKGYLASADLYLFPSLADGCASSGMEALAAGLPVIATRRSGLPIVDGESGFLVEERNAGAIADKIEWLMAHPEEMVRVGRAGAELVRNHYSWKNYAENVKGIYEDLSHQS